MSPISPDVAGFKEAQERLRQLLGQDITFFTKNTATYADDVAIDPESGEPYDPTAVPQYEDEEFTEETVKCSVFFRPIRFSARANAEDAVIENAGGMRFDSTVAVVPSAADYSEIEDATEFELNGRRFRITDDTPAGLQDIDRYAIFGEPK